MAKLTHKKSVATRAYSSLSLPSRLILAIAIVFAAFFTLDTPEDVAMAGFFDDLFGEFTGSRPAVEAPRPSSGDAVQPSQRDHRSRRANRIRRGSQDQRAHRHGDSRLAYLQKPVSMSQRAFGHLSTGKRAAESFAFEDSGKHGGALAGLCYSSRPLGGDLQQPDAILHDTTLHTGDSIMTVNGVRIFHGGSACPHKRAEFLSLAETRDLPRTKRGALGAIERAMRTPTGAGKW
jgi:hypothetical protein